MGNDSPTLRRNKIHTAFGSRNGVLKVFKRQTLSGTDEVDEVNETDDPEAQELNPFHRKKVDVASLDGPLMDQLLLPTDSDSDKEDHKYFHKKGFPESPDSDVSDEEMRSAQEKLELVQQDIDEEEINHIKQVNKTSSSTTNTIDLEIDDPIYDGLLTPCKKIRKVNTRDTKAHYEKILQVRRKYNKKYSIPSMLFAEELITRIEEHLPLVIDILDGKRPSLFYNNAREAHKKSRRAILSVDEFRMLDLRQFTAGFYGLKRQMRVSVEILDRYKEQLMTNGNAVLKWWGPTDFAQYVLAPELLCALCQKEMNLSSIDQAWDVLENTSEFGLVVADADPLEEWEVEIEEEKLATLDLGKEYSSMTYRVSHAGSNFSPR